jgi:hypothetical protein
MYYVLCIGELLVYPWLLFGSVVLLAVAIPAIVPGHKTDVSNFPRNEIHGSIEPENQDTSWRWYNLRLDPSRSHCTVDTGIYTSLVAPMKQKNIFTAVLNYNLFV